MNVSPRAVKYVALRYTGVPGCEFNVRGVRACGIIRLAEVDACGRPYGVGARGLLESAMMVLQDAYSFLSWTSLLIGTSEGTHNMTPNTRLHAPHRTSHPRPPPPRPPPRLGGKEMRRWDSEGGAQTRTEVKKGGGGHAARLPGTAAPPLRGRKAKHALMIASSFVEDLACQAV